MLSPLMKAAIWISVYSSFIFVILNKVNNFQQKQTKLSFFHLRSSFLFRFHRYPNRAVPVGVSTEQNKFGNIN